MYFAPRSQEWLLFMVSTVSEPVFTAKLLVHIRTMGLWWLVLPNH